MIRFADEDLTCDAFLGGKVHLWQPRTGYRAGVDPVLLAACVPARAGQSVLELGCGAAPALICLNARVEGLRLAGVELQPAYAELARLNGAENGASLDVFCADLSDLPDTVRQKQFDHVIANPPYYRAGAHSHSQDSGRATGLGEQTPLVDWVMCAAKRLKPKGYLHIIQRSDRLPDLLAGCQGRLGSLEFLPLSARVGRAPDLVILRARKDGRAPFQLHAPLVLHQGEAHLRDAESYVPEISAVLRNGAPIDWP
jgi:tRNA1(Val) A37 N6-methylase TrmN6